MKEITELVSNMDFTVIMLTDERGGRNGLLICPYFLRARSKIQVQIHHILSFVGKKILIILDSTGRQMSEAFGKNKWNKLELWR